MMRPSDSELSPELRAELDRSRRAGHDYDALGKLPQLHAALAATGPGVDGDAGSSGAGLFTKPPAALSSWKIVLLGAALGTAAFGAWSVRDQQAPVETKPNMVDPSTPSTPEAMRDAPATVERSVGEAEPKPEPAPSVRSSRREIDQLDRVRQLLELDPSAAYRLARQSEREFPNGLLSEERRALQVLALAKRGALDAAQREAHAFFARYPQSPMRERVEEALRR
jgi:hypothetical protein